MMEIAREQEIELEYVIELLQSHDKTLTQALLLMDEQWLVS